MTFLTSMLFSWNSLSRAPEYSLHRNFEFSKIREDIRNSSTGVKLEKYFTEGFFICCLDIIGNQLTFIDCFFYLIFQFKVQGIWFNAMYDHWPTVSLTLVVTYFRRFTMITMTPAVKLPPIFYGTGALWFANTFANFRKKSKRSYWNYVGPGKRWFMKKT